MTAFVRGDAYSQARLGKLEVPAETRVRESEPALEKLSTLGLAAPRHGLRNAIALSLVHSSYLYENRETLPGVTKASLEALNRLGGAFLQKMAAADVYRETAATAPGVVSKSVAEIVSAFPAWTVEQEWIRRSAALSVGLNPETLSPKVTSLLCRQVIGVLCLEGEEDVAARLLGDLVSTVRRRLQHSIGDPKTELQEQLGGGGVTYEYEKEGPDHAAVFRAVARDTRGRRGEGTGRSKKEASQQAALDFLERHIPAAFNGRDDNTAPRHSALEIVAPATHARMVRRLQSLFSLPAAARPLLSQALVHASWLHENRSEAVRYRQQDHQVLAHVGSWVLIYEHLLAVARHTIADPPDEFTYLTLPNRVYDTAFYETGLASGLLLGTGQRSAGVSEEVGANVFQALIGAVSAVAGFKGSMADGWPREWGQVWQLIAPTEPRHLDPTSRLQKAASTLKLRVRYEFRESGPDHARQYAAATVLESAALGLDMRTMGTAVAGKTPAKQAASLAVLSVLERLADGSPARSFDGADELDLGLARFLLAQQAFVLDAAPIPAQRWKDAKLFGLHLASDAAALLRWAVGADELLGLNVRLQQGSYLQDAFRNAVEASADPDHTLDSVLSDAMDMLERVQAPEDIKAPYLQYLVQLCDVHRCLGAEDADITLRELADDWRILHRERLHTTTTLPDVRLSGRERAIVDAALSIVLTAGGQTSVEVVSARPLHMRFAASTPLPRAFAEEVCGLWSRVARTTVLEVTKYGIDVVVTMADKPSEPGPITQAVEAALRPSAQPYRAAVADLLHDLKNQLVAARLAASQPAEGRTALLRQQLTASRHLDEAQSIALRLRAATSLLRPAEAESIELGGFVRQYARGVLDRLPSNISLAVPEANSAISVALGARALTAILNNLVGNAIEALRDGGAITLAWTSDEYEAVVEVADNGLGIPREVAADLAAGKRVRSTKPGGNGLGLLGVRSLLAQVGGQLSLVPSQPGTAWLITLPIATTPTELQ
ncbi:ATP-binding protein [Streptomyces vinaceus]|uniref:ATP-binding protein n=1 Tax=Streptomyces vinaceus TaxID=1960 RepID=UPI0035DC714E